jgi:hypothetical protein
VGATISYVVHASLKKPKAQSCGWWTDLAQLVEFLQTTEMKRRAIVEKVTGIETSAQSIQMSDDVSFRLFKFSWRSVSLCQNPSTLPLHIVAS